MTEAVAAKAEHLTKTYQSSERAVEALRGVSLEIQQGSFVAVMGASGSGKSTFLHLMGGLDQANAGAVFIAGQDILKMDDATLTKFRRQNIGFIFQAYNLVPVLSALENVALPLLLDGESEDEAKKRAETALGEVGLAERVSHKPDQLSGGEQQRVAIARALVTNPTLILADEPTGNLDSVGAAAITQLIKDLHAKGRTIVLITHDAQLAHHAETVHVLGDGQLKGSLETKDCADAAILTQRYLALLNEASAA